MDDNFNIKHNCATREGSPGSPIIFLENFGVMGIHRGGPESKKEDINYGTLLKIPIDEFNELYNPRSKPIIQPNPDKIPSYKAEKEKEKEKETEKEKGNFYVSNIMQHLNQIFFQYIS